MLRLQDWRSDLGASHSLEFYLTGEIAKNMLLCLHTFTFTMTGSCLPTQQTPLSQIRRDWPFASNCLEAFKLWKNRQLLHLHTFPFTMTRVFDCDSNWNPFNCSSHNFKIMLQMLWDCLKNPRASVWVITEQRSVWDLWEHLWNVW